MAEIKVRIGAAVDTNLRYAFKPLVQAAKDAKKAVEKEFGATNQRVVAGALGAAREQVRAQSAATREIIRLKREEERAAKQSALAQERAAKQAARTHEREAAKAARAQIIQATRANREMERFATRTSHRATRFLTPNAPIASMAGRAGRDILRGIGADASIAGSFQRLTEVSSKITALQNQASFAGQNISRGEIEGTTRDVSHRLNVDQGAQLDALERFATKTGDLKLGLSILSQMSTMAVATGTAFDEMGDATAEVANSLGDIPNKAAVIQEVMSQIAVQGAKGSVEIRDMTMGMSKIAATAGKFEGTVAENLNKLGALAQIAKATGGASSAAEAATAVARFGDQLGTNARAAEFEKAGVNIFSEKKKGKFADPIEIIRRSIVATQGDPLKMGKLFASTIGRKTTQGLTTAYNDAGGGAAGLAAVDAQIKAFMEKSTDFQEKVNAAVERRNETTAAKVQAFQNKLDDVTSQVAERLLPALERAAPKFLDAADALGKLTTYALDNPMKAVSLAIAAAVARAGIESALRTGIERALLGAPSGGPGKGGGGFIGPGGLMGVVGAGLTIASAAVTIEQVGELFIDHLFNKREEALKKNFTADIAGFNTTQVAESALRTGTVSEESAKAIAEQKEALAKRIKAAEDEKRRAAPHVDKSMTAGSALPFLGSAITAGSEVGSFVSELFDPKRAATREDLAKLDELKAQLQTNTEALNRMANGTLRVLVTNPPLTPPAAVDPSGRQ